MLRITQEIHFREQSLQASKNFSPLREIQAEWNSEKLVKLLPLSLKGGEPLLNYAYNLPSGIKLFKLNHILSALESVLLNSTSLLAPVNFIVAFRILKQLIFYQNLRKLNARSNSQTQIAFSQEKLDNKNSTEVLVRRTSFLVWIYSIFTYIKWSSILGIWALAISTYRQLG